MIPLAASTNRGPDVVLPCRTEFAYRPDHFGGIVTGHGKKIIWGRWWALLAREAAKAVLVYLRTNTPLTLVAAGFGVATATIWRYAQQIIGRLAVRPVLAGHQVVILDGTAIECDRLADNRFYSGHKKRFGVNVYAVTDLAGNLLWTSAGLPDSVHDLTAARQHQILESLQVAGVVALADKGYQGAGAQTLTPVKKRHPTPLERKVSAHNTDCDVVVSGDSPPSNRGRSYAATAATVPDRRHHRRHRQPRTTTMKKAHT